MHRPAAPLRHSAQQVRWQRRAGRGGGPAESSGSDEEDFFQEEGSMEEFYDADDVGYEEGRPGDGDSEMRLYLDSANVKVRGGGAAAEQPSCVSLVALGTSRTKASMLGCPACGAFGCRSGRCGPRRACSTVGNRAVAPECAAASVRSAWPLAAARVPTKPPPLPQASPPTPPSSSATT